MAFPLRTGLDAQQSWATFKSWLLGVYDGAATAQPYVDEPTGRAATADGLVFKVQGSGDVAAYEYRRTDSATSVLIATYPSSQSIASNLKKATQEAHSGYRAAGGTYPLQIEADGVALLQIQDDDSHLEGVGFKSDSFKNSQCKLTPAHDNPYDVCDESGGAGVMYDGNRLYTTGIGIGLQSAYLDDGAHAPQIIQDGSGNTVSQIEESGGTSFAAVYTKHQFRHASERKPFNRLADIVMVIHYGQSWSVGFENIKVSDAIPSDCLMFNGGLRTQCFSEDPDVSMTSFVPHLERQDVSTPMFQNFGGGGIGETPATGFAEMVKSLLYEENNTDPEQARFQLLSTVPGEGGQSLEALADNAQPYMQRLKLQITRASAIAASLHKTFCVGCITWIQGTSSDNSTYGATLEAMRLDIENYSKSTCGQSNAIELISWQQLPCWGTDSIATISSIYSRHTTQFDAYPHLHCAAASYHLQNAQYNVAKEATSVHIDGESTKWLGAAFALVWKRVALDGSTWQPVRPESLLRQGALCTIKFITDASLKFDVERVTLNSNYGFNLYTSAGVEIDITSVTITSTCEVLLVAASAIPSGAYVVYGGKQITSGRFAGGRGNIFNSQGDYIVSPNQVNFSMDQPCVVFKETITN